MVSINYNYLIIMIIMMILIIIWFQAFLSNANNSDIISLFQVTNNKKPL